MKRKRFPNHNPRVDNQFDLIIDELNELHDIYIYGDEKMPYREIQEYNELYEWFEKYSDFLNETVRLSKKYRIGCVEGRR